jgi:membrane protein implicated in regulation of membrane protease activity
MSVEWVWWISAALLVGAELVTGTFYLLAVGIAVALGGVAAFASFAAGAVRGRRRPRRRADDRRAQGCGSRAPRRPRKPSLDVGQSVRVETWNSDGTARVNYRGTNWDAELAAPDVPHAATMYIVATRGSRLILSDRRPSA